ncbi:MAG: hypothetical protein FJ207_11125 [Gemmatimonadetes bacterium]|nr:hypothetical protein [Gemmatimonadota bacterium]
MTAPNERAPEAAAPPAATDGPAPTPAPHKPAPATDTQTTAPGKQAPAHTAGTATAGTPKTRAPRALSAVGLDSIKNRILALALVATLVPALSTAVLSYRQNRAALTANLNGELTSRGSQAAREVDLWVKERSYDVRIFTGSFEVSENLERIPLGGAGGSVARTRLADYLAGVRSRFTDYVELQVLDGDARSIASSNDNAGELEVSAEWMTRLERGETVLG